MRRLTSVLVLVLFAVVGASVAAQETETPLFLQNMMQMMLRQGWSEEDVAGFGEACRAYNWQNLDEVNPQALMFALRYAWEFGESEEGLTLRNRAEMANALAHQIQEMARLGIQDRDIAVIAVAATRDSLRRTTGNELRAPESGDLLRTRLRDTTEDHLRDYDRDRIRDGEQAGNAYRYNEDGEPGVPPGSPVDTRPGDGSGPEGPRN